MAMSLVGTSKPANLEGLVEAFGLTKNVDVITTESLIMLTYRFLRLHECSNSPLYINYQKHGEGEVMAVDADWVAIGRIAKYFSQGSKSWPEEIDDHICDNYFQKLISEGCRDNLFDAFEYLYDLYANVYFVGVIAKRSEQRSEASLRDAITSSLCRRGYFTIDNLVRSLIDSTHAPMRSSSYETCEWFIRHFKQVGPQAWTGLTSILYDIIHVKHVYRIRSLIHSVDDNFPYPEEKAFLIALLEFGGQNAINCLGSRIDNDTKVKVLEANRQWRRKFAQQICDTIRPNCGTFPFDLGILIVDYLL